MTIVKEWTTIELMEFMNSFKNTCKTAEWKALPQPVRAGHIALMKAVRDELTERHPIIGWSYTI
jgi:hypothetical protein